jgi:hypothetical protein
MPAFASQGAYSPFLSAAPSSAPAAPAARAPGAYSAFFASDAPAPAPAPAPARAPSAYSSFLAPANVFSGMY